MKFVADYFRGKKKLLKLTDSKLQKAPRRIRGLTMTSLWGKYKNHEKLLPYWPIYTNKAMPNRDYFFVILASILPHEYEELLQEVDSDRLGNLETAKKAIRLNDSILQDYLKQHEKYDFIRTKKVKRLIVTRD